MSSADRIGIADGAVGGPHRLVARVDRERARRTRSRVVASRPGATGSVDLLRALDGLSIRDRAVLAGYFLEGRTQKDIGGDLGVSQMQVSRVLASALARLRAKMGDGAEAAGPATASGPRRRRPEPPCG